MLVEIRRYFGRRDSSPCCAAGVERTISRSFKQKRRKESLFHQVAHLEMAKEQEDKVPRPVRLVAAGCKGLFGLFFSGGGDSAFDNATYWLR